MSLDDIPHYTEEQCGYFTDALKLDPIIVAMYDEVFDQDLKDIASGSLSESAEYVLALITAQEYEDRGGALQSHLGGPFDAIKSLAKDALDAQ